MNTFFARRARFASAIFALVFFAASAHAYVQDQQYYEEVDYALTDADYDALTNAAGADGIAPGHVVLQVQYTAAGAAPTVRACYPTYVWNGYWWQTVLVGGGWTGSAGNVNAFVQNILNSQSQAMNILARTQYAGWSC